MHELLLSELGQGVEPQRMLDEPLYARDVLLVCDALADTELPQLAKSFRRAALEAPPVAPPPRQTETALAGIGGFFSSIFGLQQDPVARDAPAKSRSWFNRSSNAHK